MENYCIFISGEIQSTQIEHKMNSIPASAVKTAKIIAVMNSRRTIPSNLMAIHRPAATAHIKAALFLS